jgi:hypothetical protein
MKRILALLAALAFAGPVLAQQTLPPGTVVGRMPPNAGPSQAIPFATLGVQLGIGAAPTTHGTVEFINLGTTTGMGLIAYNGNAFRGYCTATGAYKTFLIPETVAITSAGNAGGVIRISHAATTRPLATGQFVWITQVGGTVEANEVWQITVINSTQFDLVGSVFVNNYTSGGLVYGAVAGRSDNITINNVANQSFAADTPHYIGFQFFDADCTIGKFVATTTGYSVDSTVGFNILSGYTNTPLIGQCVKHNGTIQGSANNELCVSWYNRGRVDLTNSALGNTGGLLNTWVKLTGTLDFLIWADAMPSVRAACGVVGSAALNKIDFGLSYQNSATAPDYFQDIYDISGNVALAVVAELPFPAVPPGFYRVTGWLRTVAGTATSGSVTNCTLVANTEF